MTRLTHKITPGKTPAQVVIDEFGGVRRLAQLLGKAPSTISRWAKSRDKHGTGGHIPSVEHVRILNTAKKMGIHLTADDLVWGRPCDDLKEATPQVASQIT